MRGNVTIVIGGQFGSEAKGKVISFLANEFEIAVRTGSPNAGHTVFDEKGKIYKLQQIPATFVNKKCLLFIGAGAFINPDILRKEVKNTETKERLFIDSQAGIIEEKHLLQEKELIKEIGSTGAGGGAALINRIWRKDLKLAKDVLQDFQIVNVAETLNQKINEGKNLLVEGTQGFGLSLYHGFFPFITSHDTNAANFLAEAGISPLLATEIILVIRTYPIRVAGNSGPLNNEITWKELSNRIDKKVEEITTITKRIRRVSEFDIEIVKTAITINRPTQIALQFLNYLYPEDENKNSWESLSSEAKNYIENLEYILKVPITLIGTGQSNKAMIDRRK